MTTRIPGTPVVLQTENYTVRSLTSDDVNDDYVSWWNDPEIQQLLNINFGVWTKETAQKYVQQFNNVDKFHLGIYTKPDNRLIGYSTIFVDTDTNTSRSSRLVGDKTYWRSGVSKEVSAAVVSWIFQELGVSKTTSEVRGNNNTASQALLEYLGFTKEAVLEKQFTGPQGELLDVHVYRLLRAEWKNFRVNKQPPWNTN